MPHWGPVFSSHKWLNLDDDILGAYNCWDVYATAVVTQALRSELADNNQNKFFETRVWPMVDVVRGIQRRGLRLAPLIKTKYRRSLRNELRSTEALIQSHSTRGTELNLQSPVQRSITLKSSTARANWARSGIQ